MCRICGHISLYMSCIISIFCVFCFLIKGLSSFGFVGFHHFKLLFNIVFVCLFLNFSRNSKKSMKNTCILILYRETCLNQTLNILVTCLNQILNILATCLNQTLNNLATCLNQILNILATCLNQILINLETCLNQTLFKFLDFSLNSCSTLINQILL